MWLCALLFPTPAPESQRGGRRRPLASSRPRHFLYPTSHPHVSPPPNTPHITLIPSASHQPPPRPNDAKKRTLDLDVLLQVRERATERAGEGGVVRVEEGPDAFVVEGVGAGGDEEGLLDRY